MKIHGLNRRFFDSLEKSLSDEEEFTRDQISSQSSPEDKARPANNLPQALEIPGNGVRNGTKNEESLQEITVAPRQSPPQEAQLSDAEQRPPVDEFQRPTGNSPDPSHQIEEELRQKADREREQVEGPLAEASSTAASPKHNVDHASTPSKRSSQRSSRRSSRRSSLKEKESSIEPPLPSDETKVASVETPLIIVDEELSDSDLPPPFQERPRDINEEDCEDNADYILKTRFAPLTDQDALIKALTKTNPQTRPMDVLYAIAENTQRVLKLWQDEYLVIDRRTAPHANIPRRPATGARQPIDSEVYEDMRESEIYGYTFDPKRIGRQDPFSQRSARGLKGRELRERRNRDVLETLGLSEDDAGGAGPGRRTRKPTQKVEGNISTTATTPETTRKRGFASTTPDTDAGGGAAGSGRPQKRSRRAAAAAGNALTAALAPRTSSDLVNPRIREMRASSALTNTTATTTEEEMMEEEETEADDGEGEGDERDGAFRGSAPAGRGLRRTSSSGGGGPPKRRGRPKGSKNLQKRPDAGIKKGPRGTWGKKQQLQQQFVPMAVPTLGEGDESRAGTPLAAATRMTTGAERMATATANAAAERMGDGQVRAAGSFAAGPTSTLSAGPSPSPYPTQSYLGTFPVDMGVRATGTPPAPVTASEQLGSGKAPRKISAGPLLKRPSGRKDEAGPDLGVLKPEPEGVQKRKQQAKSEKRSKSMTLWWAERKKRQAEANVQRLQVPPGMDAKAEMAPAGRSGSDFGMSEMDFEGNQGMGDDDVMGKDRVADGFGNGPSQARRGEIQLH
ncbi:MAG: hypothetical protein Q9165_004986 [Trypethelium subeluteriae]